MWWVLLLDVVVVLGGLGGLGLLAWRLVVRPGLRLGTAFADLGARAVSATEALAAASAASRGGAGAGGSGAASRRTLAP